MYYYQIIQNYSRALFQIALETKLEHQVKKEINMLNHIINKVAYLKTIVISYTIKKSKKFDFILTIANKYNLQQIVINFCYLLIENNRCFLLNRIAEEYEQLLYNHKGIDSIEIISSQLLNTQQIELIKKSIGKILSCSKVIKISKKVDPNLIAGIIIKHNNRLLDCSMQETLNRIKNAMYHSSGS